VHPAVTDETREGIRAAGVRGQDPDGRESAKRVSAHPGDDGGRRRMGSQRLCGERRAGDPEVHGERRSQRARDGQAEHQREADGLAGGLFGGQGVRQI